MMAANYFDRVDLFVDTRKSPQERLNTQKAFEELNDENAEGAARRILGQMEGIDTQDPESLNRLDSNRVSVLRDGIKTIRAGDNVDVLGIMAVAGIGTVAGTLSHKVWDVSPKDVPVNGLIGAAIAGGAALFLFKEMPLAIRGALAAAGGAFLAGSTMYVRMNPEIPAVTGTFESR
ncbi:MAG: hypothetical protein ACPG4T_05560 [Nannocystaceae bacterium]